jgi:hypothetical protein
LLLLVEVEVAGHYLETMPQGAQAGVVDIAQVLEHQVVGLLLNHN